MESGALLKSLDQPYSFGSKQLAIQRNPPRRHMSGLQALDSIGGVQSGSVTPGESVLVPTEQVIYLYYMSSHQKRLQKLLEESVKASRDELNRFVTEADKLCYVDQLWKAMLSLKTASIRRQQPIFGASSSFATTRVGDSVAEQGAQWKAMCSSELAPLNFESLLRTVRMVPMVEEEPKLSAMIAKAPVASLFQFLAHRYESEKRCRYFDLGSRTYMVITNPRLPDCATMFSADSESGKVDLFLLFKNINHWRCGEARAELSPGSVNTFKGLLSLHFREVVNTLCAYLLTDLFHNQPVKQM